jgi:hypothetical protein
VSTLISIQDQKDVFMHRPNDFSGYFSKFFDQLLVVNGAQLINHDIACLSDVSDTFSEVNTQDFTARLRVCGDGANQSRGAHR